MPSQPILPIIVGKAHYNTLGLIRSVGEEGYAPILILIINSDTEKESFVTKSKYIKELYVTKEENLIETLNNIRLDNRRAILFPSGDSIANTIDQNYNLLAKKFILPSFNGKEGQFAIANNKEDMRNKAESYGFKTPKTWVISTLDEFDINKIEFPVIIKSIHSQDAPKSIKIYSELKSLKDDVSLLLQHTPQVQIQTYLQKEKEIIFLGYSYDQEVCIPCVMEKLREYPEGFGCTGRGRLSPDIDRYFDSNQLKEFIRSYKYNGLFSAEYIIFDNKPYFLEINFRNDGNGYFPGTGGVNLPISIIQRYEGKKLNTNAKINSSYYMMREYSDFKWFLNNKYSVFKWFSDIMKTTTFQYFNKKDIKPFYFFLFNHLQNYIRNRKLWFV